MQLKETVLLHFSLPQMKEQVRKAKHASSIGCMIVSDRVVYNIYVEVIYKLTSNMVNGRFK